MAGMQNGRETIRSPRSCFVHVGTHKTGTTAIQGYLATHDGAISRLGLCFPQAGRWDVGTGHHNIAAELNGVATFVPEAGTLADALAEIERADLPRACLSSENFEYLATRPDVLARLRDAIGAIGYWPRVVIYLRAQDTYLESLYAELIKHGVDVPFRDYVRRLTRDGSITEFGVTYAFRYDELVATFVDVFGYDAVVVRGYATTGLPDRILRSFFAAIDCQCRADADSSMELLGFDNARRSTGEVIAQLCDNIATATSSAHAIASVRAMIAASPELASRPFAALEENDRDLIAQLFADANQRLWQRWKIADDMTAPSRNREGLSPAKLVREAEELLFPQAIETAT
jgi:hypothetical protein